MFVTANQRGHDGLQIREASESFEMPDDWVVPFWCDKAKKSRRKPGYDTVPDTNDDSPDQNQ